MEIFSRPFLELALCRNRTHRVLSTKQMPEPNWRIGRFVESEILETSSLSGANRVFCHLNYDPIVPTVGLEPTYHREKIGCVFPFHHAGICPGSHLGLFIDVLLTVSRFGCFQKKRAPSGAPSSVICRSDLDQAGASTFRGFLCSGRRCDIANHVGKVQFFNQTVNLFIINYLSVKSSSPYQVFINSANNLLNLITLSRVSL